MYLFRHIKYYCFKSLRVVSAKNSTNVAIGINDTAHIYEKMSLWNIRLKNKL
jgi:hypothetical protein